MMYHDDVYLSEVKGEWHMKKMVSLLAAFVLMVAMFTACGQSSPAAPAQTGSEAETEASGKAGTFDPSQIKTMADVFEWAPEEVIQESYNLEDYAFIIEVDGVYYRAIAHMPQDVSDAVWAVEYDDENADQKVRDLIAPLEVASFENLSEQIPPQEELDKLVGKTGQELFDDDWTYWSYNLEDMEAGLYHGPFSFNVKFAYDGEQMENTDDFDFYEEFKDLKVKSVTYEGLGDASGL